MNYYLNSLPERSYSFMRQLIKCIRFPLLLFILAAMNLQLFSQQFMDELKKRLPLPDQNKLLESEALQYRGYSILKDMNASVAQKKMNSKKNSADGVISNIELLDALVFFAYSNELKFEVFDKGIKQFWNEYKGGRREEALLKFEKTIYDSLDLVTDLRRATDLDKTISAKILMLKKAAYIENHATLQLGKLLYIYLRLPEQYNKNWLTADDLTDPYSAVSPRTLNSNASSDTMYQLQLQQAYRIFEILDISESQIDFFDAFLKIKYPMPDSSVNFLKLAYCSIDSLKYQWQSYLYSGEVVPNSTISGLLAFLSKSTPESKKSSSAFSYKIQILVSKERMSQQSLRKIYPGKENIEVNFEDKWYKYTIGNFKTYKEAKIFKDHLQLEGSFIVAYLNGKRVEVAAYNRISNNKTIVHEIGVR